MQYKKLTGLLDNKPNQPFKLRTKNWLEINDYSYGVYSTGSQFKFKTSMLNASLCCYSETYILVSSTIIITGGPDDATADDERTDKRNKEVIFENYAPFIKCKRKINNTKIDYTKDLAIVMPMYNLVEYSNYYSETSRTFMVVL